MTGSGLGSGSCVKEGPPGACGNLGVRGVLTILIVVRVVGEHPSCSRGDDFAPHVGDIFDVTPGGLLASRR